VIDSATMRSRLLHGLAWKVGSQLFRQGWRAAVAIVLARLLIPEDYGLAAMVLVFGTLIFIFSDLALGSALVQRKELSEEDRSTVFWTATGLGLLFTVVGVACSWPLAAFYGEDEVQPLFAALSLSFVVTALGTTQSALLNREMSFKSLELRMMAGAAVGGVVGLVLALADYGAWALIGQQLAISVVSTILLWVLSPWRPSFTFSPASLRSLGSFSFNVFGTRVLFYLNRMDAVLIGRFLGAAPLGAYSVAQHVILAPMARLTQPIAELFFPAFSRIQDEPARIGALWLRVNRLVAALAVPSMVGLMVVAPELVTVVLGEKWDAATPVIQILAWVGLLQALQKLNSSILQARDRTGVLLRYSAIVLAASLTAFATGLHWGIVGVATAYAISSTVVEPYYTWVTARSVGLGLADVGRSLFGVVQASLGMLACVLVADRLLDGIGAAPRLVLLILVGMATYVPLLLWREPRILAEARELRGLRRRGGNAGPRPTPQPAPES
jgi:O-antigen/teichoic acid export membrane protein